MYRDSTVLHRKCSVVNRESTGVLLSRGTGLYRGNVGEVRTQFIFYEMCPGASRYTGCPAPGCTVATSAQCEWGFKYSCFKKKLMFKNRIIYWSQFQRNWSQFQRSQSLTTLI